MGQLSQYFDTVRNLQMETHEDGSVIYTHEGVPHRHDGPAIISSNGAQMWFRHGERHRENGPPVEFADGSKHWYQNNVLHRARGAAIEEADGTRHWYHQGQLIALDDKAGYEYLTQQAAQKYARRDLASIANGEPLNRERMLTLDRGMSL